MLFYSHCNISDSLNFISLFELKTFLEKEKVHTQSHI